MTLWGQTLTQLFIKGGFAMWPLLLCSIIGLAVIFERLVYFLRIRLNYESFSKELKAFVNKEHYHEAVTLCRKYASPIPRLAEQYLRHLSQDALRDNVLKRVGSVALEKVEGRLRPLAAITHIAPLLGLLGTVTGLVAAFHRIEILGGQVQPGDLAAGIWEALITTVFGLLIAIPCMVAYHGFESGADQIARRMQFIISELDECFGKKTQGDFRSEDTEHTENTMKAVH